jgi:hypothetical protein
MKNLIRTYVDPMLEDRLKLLAESSGVSVSAITAELIQKGLDFELDSPKDEVMPIWLEDVYYLQFLTLQVVLNSSVIDTPKFDALKEQSRHWANQKIQSPKN